MASRHGDTELSAADLLALLDKLAAEGAGWKPKDDRWHLYAELIEATLKKARGEDLDRAAKASTLLPADFLYRSEVFSFVVSALAAREIETIRAEKRELRFPGTTTPLPESLKSAPAELREAWTYFHSVYRPRPIAKEPEKNRAIAFQTNHEKFYAVLNRLVLGETKGVLDDLALFRWDSWCGTGYRSMGAPLTWTRWLVLVRERRLTEAVSAALELQKEWEHLSYEDDDVLKVRGEFFQACGLDSEKLAVGLLASAFTERETSWGFAGGGAGAQLRALASDGSEYGVRRVLQLVALAPHDRRLESVWALDVLLRPKGYDHEHHISRGMSGSYERRSPEPLPQDVKDQAVQILLRRLAEPGESYMLREIIGTLAITKNPAVREPLRRALKHKEPDVAEVAAEAQREMGEEVAPETAK